MENTSIKIRALVCVRIVLIEGLVVLGAMESIVHNAIGVMVMIVQRIVAHCVLLEHIQQEQNLVKNVQKDNIKVNQVNQVIKLVQMVNGQMEAVLLVI